MSVHFIFEMSDFYQSSKIIQTDFKNGFEVGFELKEKKTNKISPFYLCSGPKAQLNPPLSSFPVAQPAPSLSLSLSGRWPIPQQRPKRPQQATSAPSPSFTDTWARCLASPSRGALLFRTRLQSQILVNK
jgi:hypothetical protein